MDPFKPLFDHISEHFFQPDLQAARIILGTAYSHFLKKNKKQAWLFVVGAPASGKTSITISALRGLESMFGESQPWGTKGRDTTDDSDFGLEGAEWKDTQDKGVEKNPRRRTDSKVKLVSVINNNSWLSHHAGTQAPGWLEQLCDVTAFLPEKPEGWDQMKKDERPKWDPYQQLSEGDGLFLCPDFSVITQMRRDMRGEIMSQLRRIFDGEFEKKIGLRLEKTWKGKVTIIAAVTYEIDHFLRLSSNLGERFLQIKWHFARDKEITRAAIRQCSKTSSIDKGMRRLTRELFAGADLFSQDLPLLTVKQEDRIHAIAELLAQSRCVVKWHYGGETSQREPEWISPPESTTRLGQEFASICWGQAGLAQEEEVQEIDMQSILRVGIESLDRYRSVVLQAAIEERKLSTYVGNEDLMNSALEDLGKLEVTVENFGDRVPKLRPYFQELIDEAGFSPDAFPTIGAAAEGDLINARGALLEAHQHSHRFDDDDRLSPHTQPPKLMS